MQKSNRAQNSRRTRNLRAFALLACALVLAGCEQARKHELVGQITVTSDRKLEAMEISLTEIKKVILGIINYYDGIGNTRVSGVWRDIREDTDLLIDEIGTLEEMISEFLAEPSQTRLANIKEKMSDIADFVRNLVSKISGVL